MNKIFKIIMWVLIAISVVLLVMGFTKGFPATVADDNGTVDPLLNWAYIMFGIAVACVILVGLVVGVMNDPKSLIKLLIGLVVIGAICLVVYLISPGAVPQGFHGEIPSAGTLKLTDTIMNLTCLAGGLAILAIICGEIISAVRNK
jgi:hypothetical protein